MPTSVGDPPSAAASLMYGVGLGGFLDGIVLHQILQWHHMVSATGDHPVTTVAVGAVMVREGSRSLDDRGWVPTPVAEAGEGRRP